MAGELTKSSQHSKLEIVVRITSKEFGAIISEGDKLKFINAVEQLNLVTCIRYRLFRRICVTSFCEFRLKKITQFWINF